MAIPCKTKTNRQQPRNQLHPTTFKEVPYQGGMLIAIEIEETKPTMDYEERLQTFIDQLNAEVDTYDFRIRNGRKYDYVQKHVPNYGWQDSFAIIKTTNCKVAWGRQKVKPGDMVKLQSGQPKRGSAFGTIMTGDENQLDGLWKGKPCRRAADSYKALLEDRDFNGMP